jgi:hypothetical protein
LILHLANSLLKRPVILDSLYNTFEIALLPLAWFQGIPEFAQPAGCLWLLQVVLHLDPFAADVRRKPRTEVKSLEQVVEDVRRIRTIAYETAVLAVKVRNGP